MSHFCLISCAETLFTVHFELRLMYGVLKWCKLSEMVLRCFIFARKRCGRECAVDMCSHARGPRLMQHVHQVHFELRLMYGIYVALLLLVVVVGLRTPTAVQRIWHM